MAVESQFDSWKQDIASNLRKAGEAAQEKAYETGSATMQDSDRITIALAAAQVTGQVMIAERIANLTRAIINEDEEMAVAVDRARTGEQILSRIVEFIESEDIPIGEEADVFVTMAEDWLVPDGPVGFASPEAVEAGVDAHSQPVEEKEEPREP